MNIKLLKAQSILQEALQEALFDLEDTRLKNIAVTRVECTRGREMAKVFLDENSLGDMEANDALKLLKKASGAIRANLQTQLSWYKTPNLVFEIDDSLEKINKLEEIFKKIHNDSSLRGVENAEAIQKNNPCEAQPQEASSGVGEGVVREGRGERLRNSSPLPLPQKKRALNNMGFDADLSVRKRKSIKFKLPCESLDSFRKKGYTPLPAPPTRQKAAAFSLLGGEPRFSDSSKKSAVARDCSIDSDFLHHESGEFNGASHDFF